MSFIQKMDSLKNKLDRNFIRNLGWLGGSEVIIRIFRLLTTVILARCLTSYDYGLAAIVLTTYEFTYTFARGGIQEKIIQADEQELEFLCQSAYWLNWLIFIGLFTIQCLLAFPIGLFYKDTQLIIPICVAALPYLMIPISTVQAALIHRENRLNVTALNNTLQYSVSNLLAATFAFLGLGMWSIVLPGVLVTPIWVYIYYTNHSWRPTKRFTTESWDKIFNFSKHILGVQLLQTLRNNLDYLIVGRFIGIKELGIYYFAFNAGLGISLSIIKSINFALLPHLCTVRSDWVKFKARYFSSVKTIALIIIPLVFLQTSLARVYVPIVFGQKWVVAIPVLMLICLSAIPRPFADAASQLLVAVGRPDIDLRWNIIFTVLFTGALAIGVQWQSIGVAAAVLLVHAIALPMFTWWATRYVFEKFKT